MTVKVTEETGYRIDERRYLLCELRVQHSLFLSTLMFLKWGLLLTSTFAYLAAIIPTHAHLPDLQPHAHACNQPPRLPLHGKLKCACVRRFLHIRITSNNIIATFFHENVKMPEYTV